MIIPSHCREVSLWKVGFDLDSDTIRSELIGREAYLRTRFIVLNKEKDYAVIELGKKTTGKLFDRITSVRVISLPKDTAYLEDPNLDVLNKPLLARRAAEVKKKTVVVRGMFEHVSFVHKPIFKRIRVVEIVPPFPPKLIELVRMALKTEEIETPVEIKEELVDIRKLADKAKTREVLFGCKAAGISIEGRRCLYIDQYPKVSDATIVGCDLTRRVARELYGRELPFIDICPKNIVIETDIPTLMKCCELQTSGFATDGKLAIVPWGARIGDVIKAMKYLLGEG